jgi:hypothetical protein
MRIIAAALIVIYLVSCSPPEVEPPPDPNAAVQLGEAEQLPGVLPPPSEERPRYVGRWAAAALGCEQPAWRFEEQRVSTAGEVSCEFNNVQMTPTGYTIQATCTAQAPPTQETIQLSFAESARAMMVAGGPWSESIGLTYCGPLE